MTSFWFYSVLLLLIALLFVAVPFFRTRPPRQSADNEIRRQKNIDVFRESLSELERERDEGVIDTDEFSRLKTEMQRSFLRDMEEDDRRQGRAVMKSGWFVPALCLVFVPLFSFFVYNQVGSARDLALPQIMETLTTAESPEAQEQALFELAGFLQARFERHQDDIQNGYMLGTLYLELQDFTSAIATFEALEQQMEDNPDKATVLGQLAQSMYLANDSRMSPAIQEVIDRTLALNPNEFAVLSLLAIESFVNEDYQQAITYWRRQLMQLDAGSRQAASLRDRIGRVETLLPETAGGQEVATDGVAVTLVVNLDDSVRAMVDDSMRLFVYARNTAMPMPLAAQNLALPDFPLEITLDESMAMIEGMTLSSASQVVVGARLSRSGGAVRQPGDIMAESEPFVLSEQEDPVRLNIKDVVE